MGLAESARRRDLVELRIANLRRELGAETEPRAQAAILYQVGALYEHELEQTSEAMEQYERAHVIAPGFQPALIARLRIAERAQNGHDLAALRAEQVARATSPAVSGAALLDLAMQSEDWASLLREAMSRALEPAVPALILEWLANARGDDGAVRDALLVQAKHADDPTLRAALSIDLALDELASGKPDDAIAALEHACECNALVWQARSLQAHLAREHERWDVLVAAVTSMARLLEAAAGPNGSPDPLSLPIREGARRPMAAHLWQEAATCSATHLGDADAAADYLESALRWAPDNRLTRLQSLLVAAHRGDDAASEKASEWFRSMAPEDPAFVAHELRLATSSNDVQGALQTLRDVAARFPDSGYAQAALDITLARAARHAERAEAFRRQAELAAGETQAQLAWRAAQLSSADTDGPDDAQALYTLAIEASTSSKAAIVREALGAAMRAKRWEAALARCDELMRSDIEPDERATLAYCKYNLTRHVVHAERGAEQLLRDALGDTNNRAWAPAVARARAAWTSDAGLLAQAHEEGAQMTSGDRRLGHLCAAGQAHARNRDWDAAERVRCSMRFYVKEATPKTWSPWLANGLRRILGRRSGSSRCFSRGRLRSGAGIEPRLAMPMSKLWSMPQARHPPRSLFSTSLAWKRMPMPQGARMRHSRKAAWVEAFPSSSPCFGVTYWAWKMTLARVEPMSLRSSTPAPGRLPRSRSCRCP
jgi:tetratricopeptide (TPR) repeat protein